jgi:hypothetical protein
MINDYFEFLNKIAHKFPHTQKVRVIKNFIGTDKGFIRFIMELTDDSELHVFEYLNYHLQKIDYSYHWQDKDKKLIKRWDNAPHHPKIKTFPHHLHDGEDLKPSTEPNFIEILKIIDETLQRTKN